jgi:hypothetical protein
MDIFGENKPTEVPDPEDSSTMEKSVVTFSRQRRKEPLVGDLVSSPESVGSNMEKREDAVLDMDIYRLKRNGARENAGSNPEDVSTGEGMAATLSGTGNTKPLVGYGTQSPESVRSSVGEIEDKVPCRDTYPFEGNWVKENTGSGVEGTLIWTEDRAPHHEWGRIGEISVKSHQKGESPIRLSRKGSGDNSHSHPRGLRTNIAS